MKKNILQFNIILQLGIGVFILGIILFPQYTQAMSVPLTHDYLNSDMTISNTGGGEPPSGELYAVDHISINLTKEFNLGAEGRLLGQNDSVMAGSKINGETSDTTGSYNFTGGFYGTPPLDGKTVWEYRIGSSNHESFLKEASIPFVGFIVDYWDYNLTSTNPAAIRCEGKTCTANGNGTATIKVNWYNTNPDIYSYYKIIRGEATFTEKTFECTVWLLDVHADYGGWYTEQSPDCTDGSGTRYSSVRSGQSAFTPSDLTYTITSIIPNDYPIVSNIRQENKKYTEVDIVWDYSDKEGDAQYLAQIQIATDAEFKDKDIVYNQTQTGEGTKIGVTGLQPGIDYYARVRATDADTNHNINAAVWVNSEKFRMNNYPALNIEYNAQSGTQTVGKGESITVKTGDYINVNWYISDIDGDKVDGLEPNSCNITAPGFAAIEGTRLSFRSNKVATVPTDQEDKSYTIGLSCTAKPGGVAVSENITLIVESYPLVSCSIDGKKTIRAGENVKIKPVVSNISGSYNWEVYKNKGESVFQSGANPIPNPISIDYTEKEFGNYTPWVKVIKPGTDRYTEKECGSITNLGNSNIREISP